MLSRIIFSILGFYVLITVYFYFMQDQQVFNLKAAAKQEKAIGKNIENITLDVEKNVVLDGVYRKALKADAPLILYFGSNGDNPTQFVTSVENLKDYDVVTYTYRGYGESNGSPSEEALFKDALTIYDTYAKNKKIIVVGRSLGSCVASYVASQREVAGLVLITPFDSLLSVFKMSYPFLPIDYLLKNKFETEKYVPLVKSKIAVLEVEYDIALNASHVKKLLEKIPGKPLHVMLKKATYEMVLRNSDFEKEMERILDFVQKPIVMEN